jgi:hypothetical protein
MRSRSKSEQKSKRKAIWPKPNNAVTSRKVGVNFRRQCPLQLGVDPTVEAAACARFKIPEWKWEEAKNRFPASIESCLLKELNSDLENQATDRATAGTKAMRFGGRDTTLLGSWIVGLNELRRPPVLIFGGVIIERNQNRTISTW